jgi:hypothetical protein
MIAFVDDHRGAYGVEPICEVLPIAPSTYYSHAARRADPSRLPAPAKQDARLMARDYARVRGELPDAVILSVSEARFWNMTIAVCFATRRFGLSKLLEGTISAPQIAGNLVNVGLVNRQFPGHDGGLTRKPICRANEARSTRQTRSGHHGKARGYVRP